MLPSIIYKKSRGTKGCEIPSDAEVRKSFFLHVAVSFIFIISLHFYFVFQRYNTNDLSSSTTLLMYINTIEERILLSYFYTAQLQNLN